ncbi:MAG: hypothetical protein ACYS76_16465 [Planctomycetota bacterium]
MTKLDSTRRYCHVTGNVYQWKPVTRWRYEGGNLALNTRTELVRIK